MKRNNDLTKNERARATVWEAYTTLANEGLSNHLAIARAMSEACHNNRFKFNGSRAHEIIAARAIELLLEDQIFDGCETVDQAIDQALAYAQSIK